MKSLIVTFVVFLNTTAVYAIPDVSGVQAEKSRKEASISAHEAILAAKKAFNDANLALELSTQADLKKIGQELKTALLKVERATKNAELKTDRAYRNALSSGKESASKALQEAKNAVEATRVALQKSEASMKSNLKADDQALLAITSETRQAFVNLEQMTKRTVIATEDSFAKANSELATVEKNIEDYSVERKTKIQNAYNRDLKKMDKQIAKLKIQLKAKNELARKKFGLQMTALESKRSDVQMRMAQLSKDNTSVWKDLKQGMDAALKDIKVSLHQISEDFKNE